MMRAAIRAAVKLTALVVCAGTAGGAFTGPSAAAAGGSVLIGYVPPGPTSSRELYLAGAWSPTRGWLPAPSSASDSAWQATDWQLIPRADRGAIRVRTQPAPTQDESSLLYRLEQGVRSGAALSGAGGSQPRKARAQAVNRPELAASTREILAARGLTATARPVMSEAWRVDLNGDGQDEVLWAARSRASWKSPYRGSGSSDAKPGDFALLGLRYLDGNRVRSAALALETYRTQVAWYRLLAVADVDGDGRMEILAHAQYFEEDALLVYTFGKQGAVRVLPLAVPQ